MKITVVGDVMLGGILSSNIKKYKDTFLSAEVRKFLEADVVFCNLESVLSKDGTPPRKNKILLHAKKESIELLKNAGFTIVSLANNHIMDYGYDSLLRTTRLLKENNIKYLGAGANLYEARKPVFFDKDNIKIAFLAYVSSETWCSWEQRKHQVCKKWVAGISEPGVAPFDLKLIQKDIREAKKKSDFLVVSLHWGDEYKYFPHPEIISDAHEIIDMGVDLIVGHHPHILRGYEQYHKGMIFYSLSNFLFPSYYDEKENSLKNWPYKSRQGLIVQCEVSKNKAARYKLIPVIQKKSKPIVIIPLHVVGNKLLLRMESLSKEYKTDYQTRYIQLRERENRFRYIKLALNLYETYGLIYILKRIKAKLFRVIKRL